MQALPRKKGVNQPETNKRIVPTWMPAINMRCRQKFFIVLFVILLFFLVLFVSMAGQGAGAGDPPAAKGHGGPPAQQ